jgi:hypothetical protein
MDRTQGNHAALAGSMPMPGQELPAVVGGNGIMHRQMQWQPGNVDSRGLPLSVFGTQWGCCPPLFDHCTDDEIMTLFHGLDTVEPALRWFGFRKAMHLKEKRAYLTYIAPAGTAAGTPVDGLPTTICGPGKRVEMGMPCYIEFCGLGEIRYCSADGDRWPAIVCWRQQQFVCQHQRAQ